MKQTILILLLIISIISAIAYIGEKKIADKIIYLFGFIFSTILTAWIGGFLY